MNPKNIFLFFFLVITGCKVEVNSEHSDPLIWNLNGDRELKMVEINTKITKMVT